MKHALPAIIFLSLCTPASAQFGGLLDKVQKVQEQKQKLDSLIVSGQEEQAIGAGVSDKIRTRFGVVQDPQVHRYVSLVGLALAGQSERSELPWTFIVLDTDGVNAFASPGGLIHITRGALGLIRNEAELAAVLAHEIGHVAHKHSIDAIRKSHAQALVSDAVLADRSPYLTRLTDLVYENVIEGKFDRDDELDSDNVSVTLTQKLGYAPASLADFLARLDDRNKDQPERNGLFASHPETRERIEKIRRVAGSKGGAPVEARYAAQITYEAKPVTEIAAVVEGASGLTGSTSKDSGSNAQKAKGADSKDAQKPEQPKRGFGLGSLRRSVSADRQSAQVSASGGARGVGPDRLAKGGADPAIVKVAVTPEEIAEFQKGIS